MVNFPKLLKAAAEDPKRNKLILDYLCQHKQGEYCLVLGDNLGHLAYLRDEVLRRDSRWNAEFICGTTPRREREKILSDMREGKVDFLFATYKLAKEGLDIPRLNRLYLITPKRDRVVVQQSVGRIMRPAEGKTDAIVYDFYDHLVQSCVYQARARINEVYKTLGCAINGGPMVRKASQVNERALQYKLAGL